MADNLHNILPEILITKQNLIDHGFKIDKKFVMVDSRAYTQEAFEYVLKLADLAGSLVFVYDLKKIWANGRYFGGDVFQDDLNYWTSIRAISGPDSSVTTTAALGPKQNLNIIGRSHMSVQAIQSEDTQEHNFLELKYDLKGAVNTDYVEIGGNRYNIIVENDQIKINEYKPIKVIIKPLPVLEYDSVLDFAEVDIELTLSGTLPNKDNISIEVTNNLDLPITDEDWNGRILHQRIPANTDVTYTFVYSDGITGGSVSVTQKWGYGIWIGIYNEVQLGDIDYPFYNENWEIERYKDAQYFTETFDYDKGKKILWVPGTSVNTTALINQNEVEYGLVVAPKEVMNKLVTLEFVDVSTNLTGGWTPMFDVTSNLYSTNINYLPYRTDHRGLGAVTWKIQGTIINK